jgi:hypothetical protein
MPETVMFEGYGLAATVPVVALVTEIDALFVNAVGPAGIGAGGGATGSGRFSRLSRKTDLSIARRLAAVASAAALRSTEREATPVAKSTNAIKQMSEKKRKKDFR